MPSKIMTNQIMSWSLRLLLRVCYKGVSNAVYLSHATRYIFFGLRLTSLASFCNSYAFLLIIGDAVNGRSNGRMVVCCTQTEG